MRKYPGIRCNSVFINGEGHEKSVERAYQTLKEGSQILHPIGPCFFSPCMADFIDKFGVHWCLFV
jgi:PhnB protein